MQGNLLLFDVLFIGDTDVSSKKVQDRGITQRLSRGETATFQPGDAFRFAGSHFLQEPAFSHPGISANKDECTASQLGRGDSFSHYFALPLAAYERRDKSLEATHRVTLCLCLKHFVNRERILFSLHANR